MVEPFTKMSDKSFDVRRMPGFTSIAALCLVGLYAPLVMLILFSFNAARSVTIFSHFGLNWYEEAARNTFVQDATWLSLKLAFFATCLLYTSDADDDTHCVELAGRRIIKKS